MKSLVLADTGPLVALLNPKDRFHSWARERFSEFTEACVTCEAVFTESLFLLNRHAQTAARLLTLWKREALRIDFSSENEKKALLGLMRRFQDCPMSFADACLVRMSELHSDCVIWTVDSHFRIYRRHGRQIIPVIMP